MEEIKEEVFDIFEAEEVIIKQEQDDYIEYEPVLEFDAVKEEEEIVVTDEQSNCEEVVLSVPMQEEEEEDEEEEEEEEEGEIEEVIVIELSGNYDYSLPLQTKSTSSETDESDCEECSALEESLATLLRHECVTTDNSNQCAICEEIGIQSRVMRRHVIGLHRNGFGLFRKKTDLQPFQCTFCGKYFNTAYKMRVHKFIHNLISCYKCHVCGKNFDSSAVLKVHMLETHPKYEMNRQVNAAGGKSKTGKIRVSSCSYCKSVFTSLEKAQEHARLFSSRRGRCEICNKALVRCQFLKIMKKPRHGLKQCCTRYFVFPK